MKQTFLLTTMMAFLAACGGGADASEVAKKRAERDSLKTVYAELGTRIKTLETWLAENDSTVQRNLPTVTAVPLQAGAFTHYVDVHGSVRADKAAALYALGGGRIRGIHAKAGDRVSAGQLLVSVDNDVVAKQIQQARTAVELATTTYQKQDHLWKQQIGSEMQYLQAKSQKEQAEAGLAALEEQQRLTNVTAPFAGTVDDIMVRVGELAAPGIPVARVVDLSSVQIEADVPESHLRSIRSGAPVIVRFPSLGQSFDGQLAHVGEYIDPANRTFKIAVQVPGGQQLMRPNLLSDISIQDLHSDSALVVPSRAVLQDVQGNNYIYVLDNTRNGAGRTDEAVARKVMVRRVSEYKGRLSIAPEKAGTLKGGERIVDEGAKNVTDGLTVRVAN